MKAVIERIVEVFQVIFGVIVAVILFSFVSEERLQSILYGNK